MFEDSTARLFFAIRPPDRVTNSVADEIRALPGGELPGRRVPAANWHFTLRFLGDVAPDQAEDVRSAIDGLTLPRSFEAQIGGIGAFPAADRARVVWTGLQRGATPMGALAQGLERCVVDLGYDPERRPFHAHMTIARLRPPRDVRDVIARWGAFEEAPAWTIDRFGLYRSHLGGGPPRYERLAQWRLTGG